MQELELLAPARNKEIGIAAIACGADAVYIGGDGFGARKDAGNPMEDVAELCSYAHRFGARVYMTVNTIIYDGELDSAHKMMLRAQKAGIDAFIVQDTVIFSWDDITVPLHASTQCAIRDTGNARFYESLGCGRIVLEREMTLERIKEIHEAVPQCELEFFVHGALCVCYSGNCYMSEAIAGRSANRGACIQACRSLYDLVDEEGKVLVKNKALLSLKDYCLINRLGDLADAGVCSFKIEGRLKNASYVKNCVRAYSEAIDGLVAAHPDKYVRASFGRVSGGFKPELDRTFNRGYTELFLDGKRGQWSSMDAPKSIGEFVGKIAAVRKPKGRGVYSMFVDIEPAGPDVTFSNGDGFCALPKGKAGAKLLGFRGDVCTGMTIETKPMDGLVPGMKVFRNINASFERELDRNMPKREISVAVDISISGNFEMDVHAVSEDGREILSPFKMDVEAAENRERQIAMMQEQLSKRALHYNFKVTDIHTDKPGAAVPLLSASTLNSIRRLVAEDIDALKIKARPLATGTRHDGEKCSHSGYKLNIANRLARELHEAHSSDGIEPAYELSHKEGAELMRTRYCIRHELGMCPVHQGAKASGPLYLLNNGRRFDLVFDCAACEMVVK
ncbi:MAG: U32 family peptidase [Bacteroidales bacterium]|nr:U32 family peptidase [Bacteroidales bacterium]